MEPLVFWEGWDQKQPQLSFSMLVRLDSATSDYLHIIVDSTSIPDRRNLFLKVVQILYQRCLAQLEGCLRLALIAGMPCMTAHALLDQLRHNCTLHILRL